MRIHIQSMRSLFSKYLNVVSLGLKLFANPEVFSQGREKNLTELQAENFVLRDNANNRILQYIKGHPGAKVSFYEGRTFHLMVDVSPSGVPMYEKTYNALEAVT